MTLSAWIAAGLFLLFVVATARRWMHETAAALLGAVLLWLVHYIGGSSWPALRVIGFQESMDFVDWNVVFLILGMMIFMALVAETGVFRWLAFRAYRLTRGNAWLLAVSLLLLTSVASSLLNNVTAMLLLVPLTIQIAETVGVPPLAFVIPEVLAANIGGAATLIGDPPSTIVGSALGLGFFEYALTAAAPVAVCLVLLVGISLLLYRRDLAAAHARVSPRLVAQLEADAQIADRPLLLKSLVVGAVTLGLFFAGDRFDLPPSVAAMTGAVWLIAWVGPDMPRMMREVDWTTLFFFIGVFVLVGALEHSGVIAWAARGIAGLAGESLEAATVLMVWVSGLTSGLMDNIPVTIAALPIAESLTKSTHAGSNPVLYWALILGADFGGNATYLGGAANIVAVGLLSQAGHRISFGRFVRDGLLVTVVTLLAATGWLFIRFW